MQRSWKSALICVITAFTLSAGYISYVMYQRQTALADVSRYNVAWSASQAAIELTRLQQALATACSDPDADTVQLRYNIMLNRMTLLNAGDFRSFAQTDKVSQDIMASLDAAMPKLGPLMDSLGQPGVSDRSVIRQAESLLTPLTPALLRLAAAANRFGGDMVATDQSALIRLHWQFSALVGGLILCAIMLIVLLLRHNGMLERAHNALRRLAAELQTTTVSRTLLDAALNNMSQGLCMVDSDQRVIVTNRNFATLLNLPGQLENGRSFGELLETEGTGDSGMAHIRDLMLTQRDLADGRVAASTQEELPDGRIFAITHQPMEDGGWVATYDDVTERRRAQDRITHIARHDALTGLPNRLMFREEMERAVGRVRRHRESFAVLCMDLDHFKPVNDTLGHPVGDVLLQMVANRLRGCVRDIDIVARLGGDEFAVIQPGDHSSAGAEDLARRIIVALCTPFDVQGHQVVLSTSVGIALAPQDASDTDGLMKHADLALYRAKMDERGAFRFFEAAMDIVAQDRRIMELELRHALAEEEFEVYYQPLVNVARHEICGFEALLRWRHPVRGILGPDLFLPLAEEIGLISAIGEWVLHEACAEASGWPDPTKVAINLSAEQFRPSAHLVQAVRDALSSAGLAPSRLELEITETVFLHENEQTLAVLHEIRGMGVRISMDDFGTGYSSLSYLRSFPFDKIKIDKSFVSDLESSQDSMAIVQAVAGLAATLGMTTTAEGVETQHQLDHLREQGCTEIQGYFISKPIPAADVPALMRSLPMRPRVVEPDRPRLQVTTALVA